MKHGFTLVELSIVLVIVGLLTGGILGGQALIRASELRSQLKDFDTIGTAHHAFHDKYNCVAGDCRDVASYFPAIANGNGDGRVEVWPGAGTNEGGTYFLTLEAAGLINAQRAANSSSAPEYRGSRLNNGNDYLYINFMDRYPGGGYTPLDRLGSGVAWINFASNSNSPWANGPSMVPKDAWNFDTKIDDGQALTGNLYSVAGGTGASTHRTDCIDGSGNYILTGSDVACRVIVKIE